MGQLRDLLKTGIDLAVESSNRGRSGPTQPTRVYDASRYERAPIPQDDSNNRGFLQARHNLRNRNDDSNYQNTRRGRILDRRNDRNAGQGRLLDGLRGGAGRRRPTLIGGMRDLLASHMTQDPVAMRGARPAGFSNNTNGTQPALPTTRMSPQYYQQGRQYSDPSLPSSQHRQRNGSEEDDYDDYSGNENGSSNPYYAEELEPQYQHADDLPPRYEARPADENWNARYEPRASTAPPTRRLREKETYSVDTIT